MYLVVAAVAVAVVAAAAAAVPVCTPAKKTITGFSPKTRRLTHLKQYAIILKYNNFI